MSPSHRDIDRILAVVSDLKRATKALETLHEFDVQLAMEFFERSPPLVPPLEPPSDDASKSLTSIFSSC
jgi:hypothetical protein